MKSYSEWVKENNPGNYVSVDVEGLPLNLVSALPGTVNTKPHITLMYSKNSHVPLEHIQYVLNKRPLIGTTVMASAADVFDEPPKEGEDERDSQNGCIVLKIKSPILNDIHEHLIRLGCKHSYTPFQSHATLIYGCPLDQCKIALRDIERAVADGISLKLTKFNNQWIKENWSDTLKSK
jgi:hypothetical protein